MSRQEQEKQNKNRDVEISKENETMRELNEKNKTAQNKEQQR